MKYFMLTLLFSLNCFATSMVESVSLHDSNSGEKVMVSVPKITQISTNSISSKASIVVVGGETILVKESAEEVVKSIKSVCFLKVKTDLSYDAFIALNKIVAIKKITSITTEISLETSKLLVSENINKITERMSSACKNNE